MRLLKKYTSYRNTFQINEILMYNSLVLAGVPHQPVEMVSFKIFSAVKC